MRVFLYEYTCVAGQGISAADALRAEGWAMLSALREDFGRLPGVETVTLPDEHGGRTEEAAFHALAGAADYTVVIAPEFDDILQTRCRWVEAAGGHLLGPSPAAVALAGDKLALSRHWRQRGVPTPESRAYLHPDAVPESFYPLVWKPRYGAGSQATFLVRRPEDWAVCVAPARAEARAGATLVQPYVPGQAASVAFLTGPAGRVALLPAAQHLSQDGRFHYLGGTLPLPAELAERARRLADRAVETVSGLRGYLGVDVVLGADADGSLDAVLEVNPRLTTSYVGLRALAETNLAGALLAAARGDELPDLKWRTGSVLFGADGTVVLTAHPRM